MKLIRVRDVAGRNSVSPADRKDMPIFMHITGGMISCTVEAWEENYQHVAKLHGANFTVSPSNGETQP